MFLGLAESGHRGIPACEAQAEQASPLQNQILFLAPWMLPRGEVCETQADLAVHGNKVNLLSDTLIFAFVSLFMGFACGWLQLVWLLDQQFQQMCRKNLHSCFYVLNKIGNFYYSSPVMNHPFWRSIWCADFISKWVYNFMLYMHSYVCDSNRAHTNLLIPKLMRKGWEKLFMLS